MDNHRAALWCWWQHLKDSEKWNVLHVDRHYDCHTVVPEELPLVPDHSVDLDGYLSRVGPQRFNFQPLIQWNNYLSLFLDLDGRRIDKLIFATQNDDNPPTHSALKEIRADQLLRYCHTYFSKDSEDRVNPWIVNIDLDYFTCQPAMETDYVQLYSDSYIDALGRYITEGISSGTIGVATVALSPETTQRNDRNWKVARRLLSKLLSAYGEMPRLTSRLKRSPIPPTSTTAKE